MIGDLNAHVGTLIEGNHPKVSHGGQLLKDFLKCEDYVLLNATNKTSNGPFTRIDPANSDRKAALDLCIVSKELVKYVDSMVIDSNRNFTPFRSVHRSKLEYTDHYSLLITFRNIHLLNTKVTSKGIVRWNTNRVGGWEKYQEMTNDNKILKTVALESDGDPERMMNTIEKELKRVKFESFGKVKYKDYYKLVLNRRSR